MAMKPQHTAALLMALAADALQIVLFPLFAWGGADPLDDGLDIFLAFVLFRTFGWDLAILPTALIEVMPLVDEIPTWTLTTLYLIRKDNARQAAINGAGKMPPRIIDITPPKS